MQALLAIDELEDQLFSSYYDSYHLVDGSDDDMDISDSYFDNSTQKLLQPGDQQNRVRLSNIIMKIHKQADSTFQKTSLNAKK